MLLLDGISDEPKKKKGKRIAKQTINDKNNIRRFRCLHCILAFVNGFLF